MADGRGLDKKTGPGKTGSPPFSRERFESTPQFAKFKRGMTALLAVPKPELDARVKSAKEASPRAGNPKAAGRKPSEK
jgi:hypothetical protein